MQFGVSTQLYRAQRLRHDHLAEVAAHGFGAAGTMMLELAAANPAAPALERARRAAARLEDEGRSWT